MKTTSNQPASIGHLIDQTAILSAAPKLYPVIGRAGQYYGDDDELWEAVGGRKGVLTLHRRAGKLRSIAISLGKMYPEEASWIAGEIAHAAVYLWLVTGLCFLEIAAKRIFPRLPRVLLRAAAGLYCDIATSFQAILEIMEPEAVLAI